MMFISFEGPEGGGKTTQAAFLAEHLRGMGYQVRVTREPGGTVIGDQIRAILHDLDNKAMQPASEVLLFNASRAQLVAEVIRPCLAEGGVVICDRFYDSTLAYQGYGHGLDLNLLRSIINFATGGLRPDLSLYFDIGVEAGLARRQQDAGQGGEWNRMDDYALAFHQRVAAGYQDLMVAEPQRWRRVDAGQALEGVRAQVVAFVEAHLAPEAD